MSLLVNVGSNLMCTMGTAPAPLKVTSQATVLAEGKPAATIQDAAPMSNVGPFGLCTSLANPTVAAATADTLILTMHQWLVCQLLTLYLVVFSPL